MSKLIELCEHWMELNIIIRKQISIENNRYNVFIDTKAGMKVEFSLFIGKRTNEDEKAFLKLIDNLIRYNVESNLPF